MPNLPDETLVLQWRDAPSAVRVLLNRYHAMVARIANSYAQNAADAEDYAQEGLLGLLAAVSTYSDDRAAGFRTYAAVCIRNRIRSAVRRQSLAVGSGTPEALSFDDPDNDLAETLPDRAENPEQVFLEKEHIAELYTKLSEMLSLQEAEVLILSVSGFSYREIAERLHISQKSVDNAVQRARRKLRAVWS
jgi:RNA polymerase sporulation-specific sigma factor